MNGERFDDLTRMLGRLAERQTTRRWMLGAAAAGTGAAILGATSGTAAPDRRTAIRARNQDASVDPLIGQIAFQLDYDQEKITAFVANDIAYEPYEGALRGPIGTILAGAGNSIDKAQLLQALLSASFIKSKIAFTSLDAEASAALLASVGTSAAPSAVIADAIATLTGATRPEPSPASPPSTALDAELAELRTEIVSSATADIAATATRLTDTLERAGVGLLRSELTLPDAERSRHAYVLVRSGTSWLATSVTGIPAPIAATPAADETDRGIDEAEYHRVTFRIVADFYKSGGIQTETIFEQAFPSQDLVNVPIALAHLDSSESSQLGFNLGDLLSGQERYIPALIVGSELVRGDVPMIFGGLGGAVDVFKDTTTGIPEGEPLAEFLEVEIVSPGYPDAIVRRTLFDRIAEIRSDAEPNIAAIEPVTMEAMYDGTKRFVPLSALVAFGITTGAVPSYLRSMPTTYDAEWLPLLHAIYDINRTRQYYATADAAASSFLFVDRPNVHSHTYALEADESGTYSRGRLTADLLYTSGAGRSADDRIPFGILDGVIAQRAEQDTLDARIIARISDAAGVTLPHAMSQATVGTILGQSLVGARDLSVLQSLDDLAPYGGSFAPMAAAIVIAHLTAGRIVIIPADIEPDAQVPGWWVYDPGTGRVWDEIATGQSAATLLFDTAVEYSLKVKIVAFAAKTALKFILGMCVGAIVGLAADLILSFNPFLSIVSVYASCSS